MRLTYKESFKIAKKNIKRQAEMFDKNVPGWWRDIDFDDLNMNQQGNCIRGQITKHHEEENFYVDALDGMSWEAGLFLVGWECSMEGEVHEAFESGASVADQCGLEALACLWKLEILARLADDPRREEGVAWESIDKG